MKRDESSASPERHVLCLNREMKIDSRDDIEFSITDGDREATSQPPVLLYACSYSSVVSNAFGFQTVAAAKFWDNWKCLDVKYDVLWSSSMVMPIPQTDAW